MASKTKASSSVNPSFVEFEPYCEWQKEEGVETLIIHLPDFKKEQLRVQVTNGGVLKVSGQRPIDKAQRKRFLKQTNIPKGCNINDIKAKFNKGRLYVTMPKKVETSPQQKQQQLTSPSTPASPVQNPSSQITGQEPKTEAPSNVDQKSKTTKMSGNDQPEKGCLFGVGSRLVVRLQERKKMALYFGVAAMVMVAVGAFVAYKCGSNPSCSNIHDLGFNN